MAYATAGVDERDNCSLMYMVLPSPYMTALCVHGSAVAAAAAAMGGYSGGGRGYDEKDNDDDADRDSAYDGYHIGALVKEALSAKIRGQDIRIIIIVGIW